ncbi:MAG: MotA/TolQ/ExbB proton channel family protein [Pirellulales bacterium]|nr:MotA/TolQ/ExbB proton channel family protein [Pirellulales bacterium]
MGGDALGRLTDIAGNLCYVALAVVAVWGAFMVIITWRRVAQVRFRNERDQNAFLAQLNENLDAGDFDAAATLCADDTRAVPQLIGLALAHRDLGPAKLRHLVADRFQRDVLADLEYRVTWVQTVIKSAPMLGLLGTVIGMIGAFSKLAATNKVEPTKLANDISVALITTFDGLVIAIPLIVAVAAINVRIRKMEDLVGLGLTQFFDAYREVAEREPQLSR